MVICVSNKKLCKLFSETVFGIAELSYFILFQFGHGQCPRFLAQASTRFYWTSRVRFFSESTARKGNAPRMKGTEKCAAREHVSPSSRATNTQLVPEPIKIVIDPPAVLRVNPHSSTLSSTTST